MKEFGENANYPQPEHQPTPLEDNTLDKSGLNFKEFFNWDAHHTARAILKTAQAAEASPSLEPVEAETPLQLFGVLVGALRRKQRLSLEELAGRSGLEVNTLHAIELGAVSFEQVVDLLGSLGDGLGGKYAELSRALARLTLGGSSHTKEDL